MDPNGDIKGQMEDCWWSSLVGVDEFLNEEGEYLTNLFACFSWHCNDDHNELGVSLDEFPNVGLYWGCQFMMPDGYGTRFDACLEGWDSYSDQRGANFYRGMATCKMRNEFDKFCLVCQEVIRERIENP
jgi:hypothetical protein